MERSLCSIERWENRCLMGGGGNRVILFARPVEAERLGRLILGMGWDVCAVDNRDSFCQAVEEGAGVVVFCDDVARAEDFDQVRNCLDDGSGMSELPIVVVTDGNERMRDALRALHEADLAGHVSFILASVDPVILNNSLEVAMRSRHREREVGQLLRARDRLLGMIRDSFILLDREWRFVYVNEQAARLRGREVSELIGARKLDLFPEFVGTPYYEAVKSALERGVCTTVEHYEPAADRWLESRIYPAEEGVAVLGTDITARKRQEEQLRESEERLRLIMENAREYAIFSLSLDGIVTSWNRGAEELLGFSEEEAVGQPGDIIFTSADRQKGIPQRELAEALHSGKAEDERWHIRNDGSQFWAGGQMTTMLDREGRVRGFLKILRDYTGRKRAEAWLRSLNETLEKRVAERTVEADERTAQLRMLAAELTDAEQRERRRLAQVLHDHLQQILVAAKMQVGIMVRRNVEQETRDGLQRLDQLLKRSIEASRSLTVELSPPILYDAGLLPALHWLSRNILETHGLEVRVEGGSGAEPDSDSVRAFLFQAVRELLFNVVKHAEVTRASVEVERIGGEVEVVVRDDGKGFDTVVGKERAGGFGLFSIRERVDFLGGTLKIETAPGKGTCVWVRIPAHQPDANEVERLRASQVQAVVNRPAEPAPPSPPAATPGIIRILLADDHKILREGLAGLLREQEDFEVVSEASDGLMAVAMAHDTRPDVIVMDVTMPRLNGVEATRRIREELPDVAVVGLSMHSQEDMAESMRGAGAVAYVTKGAPSDILTAAIRQAYRSRG